MLLDLGFGEYGEVWADSIVTTDRGASLQIWAMVAIDISGLQHGLLAAFYFPQGP